MITRGWAFKVYGLPKPKGSMAPKGKTKTGRVLLVEQVDNKQWRADVARMAALHILERAGHQQALRVQMVFTLPRVKSHYGTGRNAAYVKESAPLWPTAHGTGDYDKLERLVCDALDKDSGVLDDDAQIVRSTCLKAYVDSPVKGALAADVLDRPGALVRLWPHD